MDHVVPVIQGGDHAGGNVVPACWPCNAGKGASDLGDWLRRGQPQDKGALWDAARQRAKVVYHIEARHGDPVEPTPTPEGPYTDRRGWEEAYFDGRSSEEIDELLDDRLLERDLREG